VTARRALLVTAAVIAVAWLVVIVVWNEAPFALTFDDAYYYFGIARNVADGHGSTFDRINSTNGYHPLWLGLSVPFFAAGLDGMAAVRVLLAFQMLMYGAAFLLVADSVGRAVGSWAAVVRRRADDGAARWCTVIVVVVFALLVANPFVVKVFVNGLESAVVLVVDALLLWVVLRSMPAASPGWIDGRSSRWRLGIGALLAVAFLARTDAVLLVACLGLWVLFDAWPLSAARVRGLLELFGPVAVTAAVYLLLNWMAFDTPMQVSGLVKQAHLDGGRILAGFGVLAAAGLVFWGSFRNHRRAPTHTRLPLVTSFLRRTGWFAAFSIVLIGYYSVLQTQQWLWYYAPAVLYGVWLLTLLVADFVSSALVEAEPERSVVRTLGPIALLLIAPFLVAAVLQTRVFVDPELRSIQLANRDAGVWISENLPDEAVLASWDAGVVGYFSERRVVNLDGVVNSLAWHRAAERGETAAFLRDAGVGWIVNHGADVNGRDEAIDAFIAGQFGQAALDGSTIERTWPFEFSGVTTGSAGTRAPGDAPQAVFLYQLPTL
jgi:hypothetical protein